MRRACRSFGPNSPGHHYSACQIGPCWSLALVTLLTVEEQQTSTHPSTFLLSQISITFWNFPLPIAPRYKYLPRPGVLLLFLLGGIALHCSTGFFFVHLQPALLAIEPPPKDSDLKLTLFTKQTFKMYSKQVVSAIAALGMATGKLSCPQQSNIPVEFLTTCDHNRCRCHWMQRRNCHHPVRRRCHSSSLMLFRPRQRPHRHQRRHRH